MSNFPIPLEITVPGLHTPDTVLKLPLRKSVSAYGRDDSGILDYGDSIAKASRVPHVVTNTGAVVGTEYTTFDSDGDVLTLGSFETLPGDFSVELWAAADAWTAYGYMFGNADQQGGAAAFGIARHSAAGGFLWVEGPNSAISASPDGWTAGTWHHIALCRSGTLVKLWADGIEAGSMTDAGSWVSANPVTIGRAPAGADRYQFYGKISDVLVVAYAKYTSAFTPPVRGSMILPQDLFQYSPHEVLNLGTNFKDRSSGLVKAAPGTAHVVSQIGSPTIDSEGLTGTGSSGVSIADSDDWYWPNNTLRLHAKARWTNTSDAQVIYEQYPGSGAYHQLFFAGNTVVWYAQSASVVLAHYNFPLVPTTGQWYDIRLSVDPVNKAVLTVDGTPVTPSVTTALNGMLPQVSAAMTLGVRYDGSLGFKGTLKDIVIFKDTSAAPTSTYQYAMQDLRIAKDGVNLPYSTSDDGLNPISGKCSVWIKPSLLNGFYSRHGAMTVYGDANVSNGYLDLDGTGDYGAFAYNADFALDSGDFTMEAWVRPDADIEMYASGIYDGSSAYTLRLFTIDTGGTRRYATYVRTISTNIALYSAEAISVGNWAHVAMVRNGTSFKLYVNGVEKASTTSSEAIQTVTRDLYIGAINNGTPGLPWNGGIADYRIVKGTAVYTAPFTPPARGSLTPIANTVLFLPLSSNFLDHAYADGHQDAPRTNSFSFYTGNADAEAPTEAVTWPTGWKRMAYRSGASKDLITNTVGEVAGVTIDSNGILSPGGNGKYVSFPYSDDFDITDGMILTYFRRDSTAQSSIFGARGIAGGYSVFSSIYSGLYLYRGSNQGGWLNAPTWFPTNGVLYQLAIKVESNLTTVYIDGVEKVSGAGTLATSSAMQLCHDADIGEGIPGLMPMWAIVPVLSADQLAVIDAALRTPESFVSVGPLTRNTPSQEELISFNLSAGDVAMYFDYTSEAISVDLSL
jgi:hypothetical protein